MPIHNKIGGTWRQIVTSHLKVSEVWRQLIGFYVKQSSVWRNVGTLSTPSTPSLSQTNNSDGTYSISGGAFSSPGFSVTHSSTDWQITTSSDTSFSSPVYQSLNNSSNLTSINLHDKSLSSSTRLIARVRYRSNDTGTSSWSSSFTVYTPPTVSFSGSAYNSHSYTITSYSGLSASHSNSDYLLTANDDTYFSSPAYNATSQSPTSYSRSDLLKGNSTYKIRVRANFNDGRSSPYNIQSVSTGNYTFSATYTSNTTITTPFSPNANGSITVYVQVAGGRGGGSCNSSGRGRIFGMNLPLSGNTNYYAYPNGVSGGGGAACGGAGGAAAVFATTSNQAYLIGGGGGGTLQCCHCCGCTCDGCGGGGGSTSAGSGACGSCCGCGSSGSTWGSSRLGGGSTDSGETGAGGGGGCAGGNSHAYGSLSVNSLNDGGPYVYVLW